MPEDASPMTLTDYVFLHVQRGACLCPHCIDAPPNPETLQPTGPHTADLIFFKVRAIGNPDAQTLRALIEETDGAYLNMNPFDGQEHNYIELGGWIGDQGVALMLMGLGALLGVWRLFTPHMLKLDDPILEMNLAEQGMVSILARAGSYSDRQE